MINHVKKLLILFIGFFGFISFVSADSYNRRLVGTVYDSVYDSSTDLVVLPKGSFISTRLGLGKAVFAPRSYIDLTPNDQESYIFYIFWNEGRPYLYSYQRGGNGLHFEQGYLTQFRICDEIFSDSNTIIGNNNCVVNPITNGSVELFKNFFSTVQQGDMYEYYYSNPNTTWSYPYGYLCISSSDWGKSICFYGGCSPRSSNNLCQDLTGSLGLMPNLSLQDLDSFYLQPSPAVPNYNDTPNTNSPIGNPDFEEGFNFTPVESGDLVFYFENNPYYKYDVDICYVGTDDFTALYNENSSHIYMSNDTNKTVYDLFSYLYGNTFNITNVGSFINAWDMNYDEYYKNAGYGYNSYYSLSSGFYQEFGDNLTNPFVGNPVALFYMGYNVNQYGRTNTQGEEVATYCYYKLGLDEDSTYNITDDSNEAYKNNAGGFIDNRNRSHVYYSGSDSIVSQSWDGTVLDYFSGEDNLDFSNFFSKSFNRFKNVVVLNDNNLPNTGIIPVYILFFLIGIILFRFLSR